jgi:hypothetical protein
LRHSMSRPRAFGPWRLVLGPMSAGHLIADKIDGFATIRPPQPLSSRVGRGGRQRTPWSRRRSHCNPIPTPTSGHSPQTRDAIRTKLKASPARMHATECPRDDPIADGPARTLTNQPIRRPRPPRTEALGPVSLRCGAGVTHSHRAVIVTNPVSFSNGAAARP